MLQRIIKYPKFFNILARTIVKSPYPDVDIPKQSLTEFFISYSNKYSDRIAYIDDARQREWRYSEVSSAVHAVASSLTKCALVAPGSMATIVANNSPDYLILLLALTGCGCTVSICNQNFTLDEMVYQLSDSSPSLVFTEPGLMDKVSKAARQVSSIKNIYMIGADRVEGFGSVDDLINDPGDCSPVGQIDIDLENHPAVLPYSSGTTGMPKGVLITNRNVVANFLQILKAHQFPERQTMMITLPLYHIYATVIISSMSLMTGSTAVVQPAFDPIKYLTALEKYKVSFLHLVPPQILFLLHYPQVENYDLSSIKTCMSAAAPLDCIVEEQLINKFKVNQPNFMIFQGYGLTELSPVSHVMPHKKPHISKRGSVGNLVPNMECKVVDVKSREEIGPNKQGEILMRGPNVMKGYFGKAGATHKAFEHGWFLTGDIGHYDEDGYFFITDRIKELIKVQGRQVAPAELEAVLLSLPTVSDCAVVGVPHSRFGEAPRAFVVKEAGSSVTEVEIMEHMREKLSKYKQLHGGVKFIDKIPKSPSGKILRRLLKEK